jgi:hypothetical protein
VALNFVLAPNTMLVVFKDCEVFPFPSVFDLDDRECFYLSITADVEE